LVKRQRSNISILKTVSRNPAMLYNLFTSSKMPLKLITHLDVKRIISHKWIAFIVCALYGTASIAQPTTEAQAIDLALRHYPTVQLAEQNVLRHQAMERTAFNPPQPQATIEAPGDIGIGFEVVQEFDFPGVYHTRSRLLKSETGLATQGATLTRLDLKRIVRLAFLEVQTAQATTRLFSIQDSLWRDIARTSQRLFDGGEINKSELLFATTHAGQMTNALAKSQVAAENVQTQLSMFTGTQVALVSQLVKALDTVTDTEQPFWPAGGQPRHHSRSGRHAAAAAPGRRRGRCRDVRLRKADHGAGRPEARIDRPHH
jgi:hypothetical protein